MKRVLLFFAKSGLCIAIFIFLASTGDKNGNKKKTVFSLSQSKTASSLRHSNIPVWFDHPDDHLKYNVDIIMQDMDIVDETEIPVWKARIDKWHEQGKLFFAELRAATPLGKSFEDAMDDPGMQEAVCYDFNLQPITPRWQIGRNYKGRPLYLYCSNHPRFRAYLRHRIFMFMEAGADGIQVDEGGGAMFCGFKKEPGCFCPHCMARFRTYLSQKYSSEKLHAQGIPDIETFDYRQIVLQYATDHKSYQEAVQQHKIPWMDDFKDFLMRSDVELFQSLQAMASHLVGRHVPMSWDNVNINYNYTLYYPFLDVFAPETNHTLFSCGTSSDLHLSPGIIFGDKFADALGKWHTPTPLPSSWTIIRDNNLTGLLRLWTAVSYANGGIPRYPRKGWCRVGAGGQVDWYYPSQDDLEPLYNFVRTHRLLFDNYESVGQVGLVLAEQPELPDSTFLHISLNLSRLNIPFTFVVAGNKYLTQRLQPDMAKKFSLLLVPDNAKLDEAQQQIVNNWKNQGATLTVSRQDNLAGLLADRIEPIVAIEGGTKDVLIYPRAIPGRKDAPVVCHLVNWNYDSSANRAEPRKNVQVRLQAALIGGAKLTKVTYHTVGKTDQMLDFTVHKNAIRVTVPEVGLWGVLELHSTQNEIPDDTSRSDLAPVR